jgi:hypothetical protein
MDAYERYMECAREIQRRRARRERRYIITGLLIIAAMVALCVFFPEGW